MGSRDSGQNCDREERDVIVIEEPDPTIEVPYKVLRGPRSPTQMGDRGAQGDALATCRLVRSVHEGQEPELAPQKTWCGIIDPGPRNRCFRFWASRE